MVCNVTERSHCLNFTTEDLDQYEIVEEMSLKTREVEEEDKGDDYSDSNSSSDDELHEGVADQMSREMMLSSSWKFTKPNES